MAHLRVGDIEIRGTTVTIGNQQTTTQQTSVQLVKTQQAPAQPAIAAAQPTDALAVLRAVPVRPAWFAATGAVLFAIGLWAFLASGAPHDIISYILGWGVLSSIGVGVIGLGGMKRWLEISGEAQKRAQLEGELRPLLDRLRALLRTANPEQTVEWIAQKLGEPEDRVVRALGALRAWGEVQEELNTGTGEWYYYMTPQDRLAAPRDLDARLREQERNGQR